MKKLLMFLLVGIFCLSLASAWDMSFDNIKYYIQPDKTVQIKDTSIFGDDTVLIEAQLKTEQIVWVKVGSEVKVAEFSTESLSADYDTWEKVITGMKFYNNLNKKEISRAYTLKSFDGKEWKAIDMKSKIDKETIVGIFTKVESRDNIEWIMELGGYKIEEWATFVAIPYTEIKAETGFGIGANPTNSVAMGIQTKWNITDVPTGAIITNASVCYYLRDLRAGIGNGIQVNYVSNQTWLSPSGSPISATELQAMPYSISTNETLLSIVDDTWSCFNATTQLQEAIDNGDTYFTLRLWSSQFPITTIASTQSNDVLYFGDGPNSHWFSFEGLSNAGGTGKYANLDVRYDIPSNPGPKVSVELLKPDNGSNLTYSGINFNMSATPKNGNITNITLYIWNNKDTIVYTETQTFNLDSQVNMSVVKTLTNGYYNWSAYAFATNRSESNFTFATSNFTLFVNKPAPNITITYPVMYNNYSSNVSELKFVVKGSNIDSCKYSTNNGVTNVSTSCYLNLTGLTSNEGWNNWSVWANDSTGNVNNTFVEFIKDTTSPVVSIIYPSGVLSGIENGEVLNLTYLALDTHRQACWFGYNNVNTSIDCSLNTTFTYIFGVNSISVWANDTFGNIGYATSNFATDLILGEASYNNFTYETTNENFYLNFSSQSIISATANLIYNNTAYASSVSCNGKNCTIYNNLDIPVIAGLEQNNSFYWTIVTYNGTGSASANSKTYTQRVDALTLVKCESGYVALNFTSYDEQNQSRINPFYFDGQFTYFIGNGNSKKNVTITNISAKEVSLCVLPNMTYHLNAIIAYNAPEYTSLSSTITIANETYSSMTSNLGDSYPTRNYFYQDYLINDTMENVNLYLLRKSASTQFILQVQDRQLLPVLNVLVEPQRCYPGTSLYSTPVMFKARTDSNGLTTGNFEAYTALYQFIITNQSKTILAVSPCSAVLPQTSPYTLIFQLGSGYTSAFVNINNVSDITETLFYNKTNGLVSLAYVDTSGDLRYSNLKVISMNYSGSNSPVVCNEYSNLSTAILYCNVSTAGSYSAQAYFYRTNQMFFDQMPFEVSTFASEVGYYGVFLAFFIILISAFAFKWNEIAGIWMVNVAVIFCNVVGLVSFGKVFITAMICISVILTAVMER